MVEWVAGEQASVLLLLLLSPSQRSIYITHTVIAICVSLSKHYIRSHRKACQLSLSFSFSFSLVFFLFAFSWHRENHNIPITYSVKYMLVYFDNQARINCQVNFKGAFTLGVCYNTKSRCMFFFWPKRDNYVFILRIYMYMCVPPAHCSWMTRITSDLLVIVVMLTFIIRRGSNCKKECTLYIHQMVCKQIPCVVTMAVCMYVVFFSLDNWTTLKIHPKLCNVILILVREKSLFWI